MIEDAASFEPVCARQPPLALVVQGDEVVCLSDAGEVDIFPISQAARRLGQRAVLVCHARLMANRLGVEALATFDVLELFAFVRPAKFVVPTVRGVAQALEIDVRERASGEEYALVLWEARSRLLGELSDLSGGEAERAVEVAQAMARGGWAWADDVLAALGYGRDVSIEPQRALAVWNRLPEWEDFTPAEEKPAAVESQAVRAQLAVLVKKIARAEPRAEQGDYACALSAAFSPVDAQDEPPHVVLAEAGTGVGKTLGYLAPASLWSAQSGRAVWVSTYTKNLQRQIEDEARRVPSLRTAVRKGRENYLCLLNFEEAVRASFGAVRNLVPLGLVARWLEVTGDGDVRGGDLPGWMAELMGRNRLFSLADRRGECVHGACPHYKRCFIERSVRAARVADVVIANHALVLGAAASGGVDERLPPSRFIFDEGHHLFHAADSAFGVDLSGQSAFLMRRWLLGGEGKSKGRVRGLSKRAEPLLPDQAEGMELLEAIRHHAAILPGEGWLSRVEQAEVKGLCEHFLLDVRAFVLARDKDAGVSPYSLECAIDDPTPELVQSARQLRAGIEELALAVRRLRALLMKRLEAEASGEGSEGGERAAMSDRAETAQRIDSLVRTLESFVLEPLRAWMSMLDRVVVGEVVEGMVDWMGIDRVDGHTVDVGFFRRMVDPTVAMAEALQRQARGIVITSATLSDAVGEVGEVGEVGKGGGNVDADWAAAEAESGARHYPGKPLRVRVPSPFDYAAQTRVLIVNDVDMRDMHAMGKAYLDLFLASKGGALGLFTAIERLKRVHAFVRGGLAKAGLPLYAQHLDGLDPHTLVDIFRAEGNACLLGTDAVRDGVDVPGRALRLIVFDKVPWPRTDLLLKARKEAFGKSTYVERLTRQRLRQAYGRLVRRADDHGVFVILSPLPSKFYSAFPGVKPQWANLEEACRVVREFVG